MFLKHVYVKKDVVTLGNVLGQGDGEQHRLERKENWQVRLRGPVRVLQAQEPRFPDDVP